MCSARIFGTGILGSDAGTNTKAIVAVSGGDAPVTNVRLPP